MFFLGMFYAFIGLVAMGLVIFGYIAIAIAFKCTYLLFLPFLYLFLCTIGAIIASDIQKGDKK